MFRAAAITTTTNHEPSSSESKASGLLPLSSSVHSSLHITPVCLIACVFFCLKFKATAHDQTIVATMWEWDSATSLSIKNNDAAAFASSSSSSSSSRLTKRCSTLISPIFVFILFFVSSFSFSSTDAYDSLDPKGHITIKWDIITWNPDGYVAVVTIFNFQKYRHIEAPGWTLGWTWTKREVIWSMIGGQATDQGDCSRFKGNIPHCCKKTPTVVDLLPGTPFNLQVANCCKGGVISSMVQDRATSASSFQLTVGQAGTSNTTVRLPKNFTLATPGPGYTCGPAKIVPPSKFATPDKRRATQAMMTWNVTCMYSQFLAQRTPTCCVSLSAFYNDTIVNCPTCSCSCRSSLTKPGTCVESESPYLASAISSAGKNKYAPLVRCTPHMCPIRVHWHIKVNYKEYWRVKITVTNFNYRMNYSQWNLVVQHPNLKNLTQIFSFNSEPLTPYPSTNDTAMLWGIKYYNDLLMQAGPSGNVQSELIFQKDKSTFTFHQGWGFPRRIYFNGDICVMPSPDLYPHMPNASFRAILSRFHHLTGTLLWLVLTLGFF